jgi:hypothetical protein
VKIKFKIIFTYTQPPPGGEGYVPLVGTFYSCSSFPYLARRQAGYQSKSLVYTSTPGGAVDAFILND